VQAQVITEEAAEAVASYSLLCFGLQIATKNIACIT